MKRHIKTVIRLAIEADGSVTTMAVRASKGQLIKLLDYLIPDPEQPTPKTK